MAIVRQKDPRTGTIYVYSAVSTYHPELHQSRSKRKLIGKVDPETGEVVPCGKRGRPRKNPEPPAETGEDGGAAENRELRKRVKDLTLQMEQCEAAVRSQKAEIAQLQVENDRLWKTLDTIHRYSARDKAGG